MKVELDSAHPVVNLRKIAEALSARFSSRQNIGELRLSSEKGEAYMMASFFNDLATFMSMQFKLNHSLQLEFIPQAAYHPLKMIYCFKTSLTHFVQNNTIKYELTANTASLAASTGDSGGKFLFSESEEYQIVLIELNRGKYLRHLNIPPEQLNDGLKNIFNEKNEHPFYYLFRNHHRLNEGFSELQRGNSHLLSGKIYFQSRVLFIASSMIKLYEEHRFQQDLPENFSIFDYQQINLAKKILLDNLQKPPIIKTLARQIALNESKLKRGFKEVFNITIYNFIIEERMKLAMKLLNEHPEMAVSEVAEKVGYNNKSQFSARFKKHFNILPGKYKKRGSR